MWPTAELTRVILGQLEFAALGLVHGAACHDHMVSVTADLVDLDSTIWTWARCRPQVFESAYRYTMAHKEPFVRGAGAEIPRGGDGVIDLTGDDPVLEQTYLSSQEAEAEWAIPELDWLDAHCHDLLMQLWAAEPQATPHLAVSFK